MVNFNQKGDRRPDFPPKKSTAMSPDLCGSTKLQLSWSFQAHPFKNINDIVVPNPTTFIKRRT